MKSKPDEEGERKKRKPKVVLHRAFHFPILGFLPSHFLSKREADLETTEISAFQIWDYNGLSITNSNLLLHFLVSLEKQTWPLSRGMKWHETNCYDYGMIPIKGFPKRRKESQCGAWCWTSPLRRKAFWTVTRAISHLRVGRASTLVHVLTYSLVRYDYSILPWLR